MDTDLVKRKVLSTWSGAVFDREDDQRVWFVIDLVTSYEVNLAKLPYWQLLPKDYRSMWFVVFKE